MSWIRPISAKIFKTMWRTLGEALPQVPIIMGVSKKLSRDGPISIPMRRWNEMEGRSKRLLSRIANLERRMINNKKKVR